MKTVSRTKTLLIAAALPLIAAPALSVAEVSPPAARADAMDACVKAFVSTNFEKQRRYSVVTSDRSHFDPQASAYRITLTATGKESGKQLAKATCVVDGSHVALTSNGKSTPALSTTKVASAR